MNFRAILSHRIFFYSTLVFVVLGSTFILLFPFIFHIDSWFGLKIENPNLNYIYTHFDGPLYIVVAKSFYDPRIIENLHLELALGGKYFAAHFPLYPLFIRLFHQSLGSLGWLKSTVFVNILFTVFLVIIFYFILHALKLTKKAFLLTLVFLFLPRFLVVRSVGGAESMFIFFILLSLFSFERKNYLYAGLFGSLATLTKSPGILLFFAYVATFIEQWLKTKKFNWNWLFVFTIPLSLSFLFFVYWVQYDDFFAYFNSGDNIHLVSPFSVFNFQKTWVGTAWLEEIIFYFFIYLLTVLVLWRSKLRGFFYFSLVFFTATVFVQHRDISRYSLPLWPLACIAFERFFTSRKFMIAFIILLPAVYFYAINFLLYNVMPVSNWKPFL